MMTTSAHCIVIPAKAGTHDAALLSNAQPASRGVADPVLSHADVGARFRGHDVVAESTERFK
jgi:hypothetical protein